MDDLLGGGYVLGIGIERRIIRSSDYRLKMLNAAFLGSCGAPAVVMERTQSSEIIGLLDSERLLDCLLFDGCHRQ